MKEINLLPKDRQRQIRYEIIFSHWLALIWLSVFSFGVVLLLQFGSKVYLQTQLSNINRQILEIKQQVNRTENAELKKKIKEVNDLVADYNSLADNSPKWSGLLKIFSKIPPEGIKITSFTVDLQTKKIAITGIAPTRELVIELHDNILADKEHFTNVDYPLENIAKATNISFHYSFNFKEDILN